MAKKIATYKAAVAVYSSTREKRYEAGDIIDFELDQEGKVKADLDHLVSLGILIPTDGKENGNSLDGKGE